MKRLVIVIFVIVAAALGILFFMGDSKDTGAASVTRSQTVIPKSATQQQDSPEIQAQDEIDDSLVSLIPLRNDEILMGILGIDFDGDGYDDQINTIRSMTSPYIKIIVGLYNPYKGQYERSAIIDTEIIQTRTFSYTCMDIIGNHRNVLSYSGFLEDGNSVMKLFLPEKRDTGLIMNVIGDFRSDGTIFIQQLDRHESYLSQKANGVSYPVWVYRSDNSQGENSLDQIQTRYIWDIASGKYVKDTETKVREAKVSTRELNKILDGTMASFKKHLDGLWFSSDTQQFIFFTPREEEIIFQTGDTQEVYTWVSSTLRRNGIYITAINSSINNLTRR
ncbi:MAG: pallilysin-related adhesin, partial [Spirochaetaceae bacterium]|nr:pallilysin-related adhesin [Spirochaetaceae bacterium]